MVGQHFVKFVASKPPDGQVDLRFAHELPIVNYPHEEPG